MDGPDLTAPQSQPDPKCIDEWACMMPGDCQRAGRCLADTPPVAIPDRTAVPGPVSGPDELLAEIDDWIAGRGPGMTIDLMRRCRTRIAANAALADDNARMKAKLRIMLGDPEVCNGTMVRDPETTYRYEPDCVRRKRENAALAARCESDAKFIRALQDESANKSTQIASLRRALASQAEGETK